MVYVGSKNRIAKHIIPVIQDIIDKNNIQLYVEPFVGGANIIDKIKCVNRVGYDKHSGLISIYLAAQGGWTPPPHINEEIYQHARNGLIEDPLRSYIGFQGSYATKWFGGYARGKTADGKQRDIYNERTRNFIKQIPLLKDIEFGVMDFFDLTVSGALVYCDPPYVGTTEYKLVGFNYSMFWKKIRYLCRDNHVVVSEFNAPRDFKCIWSKERVVSLDNKTLGTKPRKIERLFVYGN